MKPMEILSLSKAKKIFLNELKADIEAFACHQFRQLEPGEKQTHNEALSYELGMISYHFREDYDVRILWALVCMFQEEGWGKVLLCLHPTNPPKEGEKPWLHLNFAKDEVG